MRNLLVYHISTLIPLVVIFYLYEFKYIDVLWLAILMLIYGLCFRPVVDYYRLKALNIMKDNEFWKIFGMIRFRYYKDLMFKK